jgi:hypothetical protein
LLVSVKGTNKNTPTLQQNSQQQQIYLMMNQACLYRWLTPKEVHNILSDPVSYNSSIRDKCIDYKPMNEFIIFDRSKVKFFRKDGHSWKKNSANKLAESHSNLTIDNSVSIRCYYSQTSDDKIQRRIFIPIPPLSQDIVLVQYRPKDGIEQRQQAIDVENNFIIDDFLTLPEVDCSSIVSFDIIEYSPNWDYIQGGTKVLLLTKDVRLLENNNNNGVFHGHFGDKKVSCEPLNNYTGFRCYTPQNTEGTVDLFLSCNDIPCSNTVQFTYKKKEEDTYSNSNWLSMDEREFKVRIVERLSDIETIISRTSNQRDFTFNFDTSGDTGNPFENTLVTILSNTNLWNSEAAMDRLFDLDNQKWSMLQYTQYLNLHSAQYILEQMYQHYQHMKNTLQRYSRTRKYNASSHPEKIAYNEQIIAKLVMIQRYVRAFLVKRTHVKKQQQAATVIQKNVRSWLYKTKRMKTVNLSDITCH